MGQVPIDAVSKLREIFRVLIGDSAEEWESQKQQSEFGIKTDLEWTAHLLSIHRRYCTANDGCNLPHYQSNDLSSHTLSWENKPPSPVPVSAPIPSHHRLGPNVSSAATKANITGFYQRPHLPRRVPYSFNRHAQRRRGGTSKTSRYRSNFTAKPSSSAVTPDTVNTEASTSGRIVESEETEEDVIIIKEEPGYEYEEASTEDMYEGVAEYGRAGDYNERVSGESYSVGVMPGFSESEAECAPDPEDFGDGDGVSVKLEAMESKVEEVDGEEQQTADRSHDISEGQMNTFPNSWQSTHAFYRQQCEFMGLCKRCFCDKRACLCSQSTEEDRKSAFANEDGRGSINGGIHGRVNDEAAATNPDRQFSQFKFPFGDLSSNYWHGMMPPEYSPQTVGGQPQGFDQGHAAFRYQRSSSFYPVTCDVCGKVYSNKWNLNVHMMIHQNLRPFVCPHCGQKFRHKQHLQRHLLSVCKSPMMQLTLEGMGASRAHQIDVSPNEVISQAQKVRPLHGGNLYRPVTSQAPSVEELQDRVIPQTVVSQTSMGQIFPDKEPVIAKHEIGRNDLKQ